jgi:hypothetical protein
MYTMILYKVLRVMNERGKDGYGQKIRRVKKKRN